MRGLGPMSLLIVTLACQSQGREEPPQAVPSKLEIVAAPASGDVAKLVREAQIEANRARRKLLVYVSASWCEPCRHFQEAAARGQLDGEFGDLRLLKFDFDRDEKRLARAGYQSKMIPLWVVPEPSGRGSDKRTAGSIKGPGAVGDIRPRLRKLREQIVF
ncbi:MAG: thioredoxin family protein [Deltaproteobacteria bacterium]|nr:thioredoxin family protein [Deltaproteobacteria bacterium]